MSAPSCKFCGGTAIEMTWHPGAGGYVCAGPCAVSRPKRCLNKSPQGLTCGLEPGHDGEHSALGWAIPEDKLPDSLPSIVPLSEGAERPRNPYQGGVHDSWHETDRQCPVCIRGCPMKAWDEGRRQGLDEVAKACAAIPPSKRFGLFKDDKESGRAWALADVEAAIRALLEKP